MDDPGTYSSWLNTLQQMRANGHDVKPFAAIEIDKRGIAPFSPLLDMIRKLKGEYWVYMLDDRRTEITTGNRLRHLTMGQNLVTEYATAEGASHLLFCAADCQPPAEIEKLLEMNSPYVGPEISTYCLSGEPVEGFDFPVQKQLLSVACVLIERSVFKRLRWRTDPDLGLSDDPSYQLDAEELLSVPALCRKDVYAKHYPEAIGPIEHRGHDLKVRR